MISFEEEYSPIIARGELGHSHTIPGASVCITGRGRSIARADLLVVFRDRHVDMLRGFYQSRN